MEKIKFEDFEKLDLRIATIKAIKNHPDADKLYILDVEIGKCEHDIQIVAGIRGHYKEDELIGKQIVIVRNLEPAVIRGIESQGMLLAASFKDKLTLVIPEKKIQSGSKVK